MHGNPTTFTNPSGHQRRICYGSDGCYGGYGGGCHSDASCDCYSTCIWPKCGDPGVTCVGPVPPPPPGPKPAPVPPACSGTKQQCSTHGSQPPTCTSDANCGCYSNCGQAPLGAPACEKNVCNVGESRIPTLLWLAGHDTSALMGRGETGIGLIIDVLNKVISKINFIAGTIIGVSAGAAVSLLIATLGVRDCNGGF